MMRRRGRIEEKECKCVGCNMVTELPRSHRTRFQESKCQNPRLPPTNPKRKIPSAPGGKIVEFKLWDYDLSGSTNADSSQDSGVFSQGSGSIGGKSDCMDGDVSTKDVDVENARAARKIQPPPSPNITHSPSLHPCFLSSSTASPPLLQETMLDELCEKRYHHLIETVYLCTKDENKAPEEILDGNNISSQPCLNIYKSPHKEEDNCETIVSMESESKQNEFGQMQEGLVTIKSECFSDEESNDNVNNIDPISLKKEDDSQEWLQLTDANTNNYGITIFKNENFSDNDDGDQLTGQTNATSPMIASESDRTSNETIESGQQIVKSDITIDAVFSLNASVSGSDEKERYWNSLV